MRNPTTKLEQTVRLVWKCGTLRPRDLAAHDIPGDYLDRLHRRGVIERVSRGLYAWPGTDVSENHTLAEVARLVPAGVVCLISALQFHGLTTQIAHEVWLALPNKAWAPKVKRPKLRIFRFTGRALTEMIEEHTVEKVVVKVGELNEVVAEIAAFLTSPLNAANRSEKFVSAWTPSGPWS